ncbi:MAG TPA: InlB B-repeat-containing protein, partial [Spirochaetota bacterium]|nr:InlB B-repeat-containing protein [Spirochaetota bacterium]
MMNRMYIQLRMVICILGLVVSACNVTVYDELFDPALMKVTYYGNGSTAGDVPVDPTIYEKGQEVIVSGNLGGLVRTGYTYVDWNTSPDGSGTGYSEGDTFLIETFGLVLYAQWIINQYTLSYAAGANGSLSGTTLQTVNYGSNGTVVTAVPGTGYHFVQWNDGVMTAPRTDTNVTGDITATATFG